MSLSSDYFDDDPEFVKALAELPLPGADEGSAEGFATTVSDEIPQSTQSFLKRPRPADSDEEDEKSEPDSDQPPVLTSADKGATGTYLTSDTYGASRFGGFGEYMRRKRQKLQVQNADIDDCDTTMGIFRDLQIYINGWTEPSVQELRQLIVKHGGVFHAYLDKKSMVTHIITCSLTPAKMQEFKHMRVIRPEWLVKSAEAGVLLPWHDYRYKAPEKAEQAQGKKNPQRSLAEGFASQRVVPPTEPSSPLRSQAPATPTAAPSTPKKQPLYSTDPSTPEQAARVPGYAADESNVAAQRAMADPAWRAAHTSAAPDFIEGYYRNSRLHHLSTWKAELRDLVAEAQERAENGANSKRATSADDSSVDPVSKIVRENMDGKNWTTSAQGDHMSMKGAKLEKKGKGKEKEGSDGSTVDYNRIIMHCDFDSFFVSAGLVDRPHLRGKPVVVCHSQGAQGGRSSTSEIASASYEARKFGIKSGMSLQQARKLCPAVLTIPYEFQRYKQFSLQFYTILMAHADDLQAVSVDEALIDVTSSVRRIKTEMSFSQSSNTDDQHPAKQFAEAIRSQIKGVTGCEVSIGIAHNIILARLASRRAKPAGSFHLLPVDVPSIMDTLDIDDLHGFGYATHQKAQEKLGATALRELVTKSKAVLCDALGKGTGETLFKAMRGIDDRKLESDKPRRSVSCDINYGIRFEDKEQAEAFIYQLSEEVARRLDAISMCGRSLTLKIMKRDPSAPVEAPKFMGHGLCETFTKQAPLIAPGGRATSDANIIADHAWRLLQSMRFDPKDLRGVAIQVQKLEKAGTSDGSDQGQSLLPFIPVTSPQRQKAERSALQSTRPSSEGGQPVSAVSVDPHPVGPSSKDAATRPESSKAAGSELPSFSQVDMSVFEALPDDIRNELKAEYKRRSVTPCFEPGADYEPTKETTRARSLSVSRVLPLRPQAKKKFHVKGTSNMNVKRITRQLAPKSRVGLSPAKTSLFNKKPSILSSAVTNSVKLRVSDAELVELDIDPEVFRALPDGVQREQLALAKHQHAPSKGAISYVQRKILKPRKHTRFRGTPGIVIPPPPPPKAVYPDKPTLKQRGKLKGEKLYFTETEDIQGVVETWFNAFREKPPNDKDIAFFETWLVKCVDGSISTDGGVEKAIKVMKWWLVLLKRHFAAHEAEKGDEVREWWPSPGEPDTVEVVGTAWWNAFRAVKAKMDAAAKRKFGGRLSLR